MTFTFKLARRMAHSRVLAPRLFAVAILLAGCADANGTESTSPSTPDTANSASTVASVTVTPGSASGSVGQSAQFSAIVKNAAGTVLSGQTVTWSVGNSAVVKVSASGYATAVGGGSTTINATIGGVTGRASVTVTGTPAVTVGSVTVSPGTMSGNVGDGAKLSATVKDATGATITTLPVSWTSSNPAVVTVDSTGYAKGIGGGTADVLATAGGKSGKATITVTGTPTVTVGSVTVSPGSAGGNVGDAAQFTATVKDAAGVTLTGQTVTWSSSNTNVVTVTASGYATAVGGGTASLIATAGGKSGSAAITVTGAVVSSAPVAVVSLTPTSVTVGVGATQQIAATLKDASGNTLTGRTITWASSASAIGSISASGLVTGLVAGTTTITATSEGKSASATITVNAVVTPPLPPPPTGGMWAHEPSGLPAITDNAFNALTTSDGWQIEWNDAGNGSIVQDATAPASASSVLEMKYPIGYAGGSGPANDWRPIGNAKRLYLGFYWKASNPWQGHSSNVNKILFLFPSSGGDIYIVMYGPPGGPYELRVLPQFTGMASDWLRPNVNNVPVTLGSWHKIEWYMDYASGTVQWWMDGVMIGNYSGVPFPSGGMSEVKINPTWGGIGETKSENDYFRYDQIHISGN